MSTRATTRWRNWGNNYGRRTGGYTQWRNYWNRYSNGAQRRATSNRVAASQQRDSCDVVLNILHKASTFYLRAKPGDNEPYSTLGVYAVNIYDLMRQSSFFDSYATMYDQFKVNSIQVKCTAVQWSGGSSGIGAVNGVTVCTAWDRNGLDAQQILEVEQTGGNEHNQKKALYVTVGDEIGTYSSSYTKVMNPHTAFTTTRTLYPSTIQEKGQFIACADLVSWYSKVNAATNAFVDVDNAKKVNNPCYLEKDNAIPFKPTFLLGIIGGLTGLKQEFNGDNQNLFWGNTPAANNGQQPQRQGYIQAGNVTSFDPFAAGGFNAVNETLNDYHNDANLNNTVPPIVFNLEFDIGVTFRGLRKAPIVDMVSTKPDVVFVNVNQYGNEGNITTQGLYNYDTNSIGIQTRSHELIVNEFKIDIQKRIIDFLEVSDEMKRFLMVMFLRRIGDGSKVKFTVDNLNFLYDWIKLVDKGHSDNVYIELFNEKEAFENGFPFNYVKSLDLDLFNIYRGGGLVGKLSNPYICLSDDLTSYFVWNDNIMNVRSMSLKLIPDHTNDGIEMDGYQYEGGIHPYGKLLFLKSDLDPYELNIIQNFLLEVVLEYEVIVVEDKMIFNRMYSNDFYFIYLDLNGDIEREEGHFVKIGSSYEIRNCGCDYCRENNVDMSENGEDYIWYKYHDRFENLYEKGENPRYEFNDKGERIVKYEHYIKRVVLYTYLNNIVTQVVNYNNAPQVFWKSRNPKYISVIPSNIEPSKYNDNAQVMKMIRDVSLCSTRFDRKTILRDINEHNEGLYIRINDLFDFELYKDLYYPPSNEIEEYEYEDIGIAHMSISGRMDFDMYQHLLENRAVDPETGRWVNADFRSPFCVDRLNPVEDFEKLMEEMEAEGFHLNLIDNSKLKFTYFTNDIDNEDDVRISYNDKVKESEYIIEELLEGINSNVNNGEIDSNMSEDVEDINNDDNE